MSHGYIYKCIILYYVTRVHIIVHKLFNWRNRFSSTRCTKVVRVRMHIRKRLPHIHQLPLRERVNRKRDFPRIHTNPSSATCPSANTHATLYTNTHTNKSTGTQLIVILLVNICFACTTYESVESTRVRIHLYRVPHDTIIVVVFNFLM